MFGADPVCSAPLPSSLGAGGCFPHRELGALRMTGSRTLTLLSRPPQHSTRQQRLQGLCPRKRDERMGCRTPVAIPPSAVGEVTVPSVPRVPGKGPERSGHLQAGQAAMPAQTPAAKYPLSWQACTARSEAAFSLSAFVLAQPRSLSRVSALPPPVNKSLNLTAQLNQQTLSESVPKCPCSLRWRSKLSMAAFISYQISRWQNNSIYLSLKCLRTTDFYFYFHKYFHNPASIYKYLES